MNLELKINVEIDDGALLNQLKAQAYERATWAYRDVMIGFEEVGIMPTKQQKENIMQELAKTKLLSLFRQNNISWS